MRILVVEDEPGLAATIGDYLALNQYQVDFAASGESALGLVEQYEFDAVLLDINLPRMDGLTVCAELRSRGETLPILMLTARDTLDDVIAGFEQGTDDYLVKPFALEEMLVRLRALSKRGRRLDTGTITVGDLELNLGMATASRRGQQLKLTSLQFNLLKTLVQASPGTVSRKTLEYIIWQDDAPDDGALRMHIHRLRNIVDKGFDHPLIATVHGKGFRIGP